MGANFVAIAALTRHSYIYVDGEAGMDAEVKNRNKVHQQASSSFFACRAACSIEDLQHV
jgi:hypothetical protein